ncbi:MAG: hypothetical protein QF852_03805 [Candidatus Marinimicrobia bacterium]|nr:hypothetical protein [Candidatus Neomarinimicrobiota bacterium]
MKNHLRKTFILVFCFVCVGCASIAQKKRFEAYNNSFLVGNYLEAASIELENKSNKKNNPSDLLITLQGGAALRYAKKYSDSTEIFDESEAIIKKHNEELLLKSAGSQVGSVLWNDTAMDYKASEYDGIMVNTYKGLNFWQQGDFDLARVEFNRALDRQRRAKERFAEEIAEYKKGIEEKEKKNKGANISANLNNPLLHKGIESNYSNLKDFRAYPDFINPFTTYISGLFFMSQGDYQKSSTLLKQSFGMVDHNEFVENDFELIEYLANGGKNDKTYTWVIIENGLGPVKEEFRVDLPIGFLTNRVKYTGIALPKLKLRDLSYKSLNISSNEQKSIQSSVLASMDRVVQTEFDKRYPIIVGRAVMSAAIKTVGQYFAQDQLGSLGGLAVAAYQVASTSADIRMWTALPKEFQLAKLKTPKDGVLSISAEGVDLIDITVPKNQSSIVYIKSLTKSSELTYSVTSM